MSNPLTWLYVPAVDLETMRSALGSGADAVVYDLEDTVVPARRDEARELVRRHLDELGERGANAASVAPQVLVRINSLASVWGTADIEVIRDHVALDGVRVPKVDRVVDLEEVAVAFGSTPPPLYPLLESAEAIENASAIARHPAARGLVIGEQDLRVELGIRAEAGFSWIRSRVLVAARAAGLPAPPLNVYTDTRDDRGLAASCRAGRELGMFGRSALDPRQIPVIRAAFTPDDDEVEAARTLVAASDEAVAQGRGAAVLPDGRFVDEPIVEAARRTLTLHQRLTRWSGS